MKRLFVDLDICIGCQAHSAACHWKSQSVETFRNASLPNGDTIPTVCRHCEEPMCVAACPNNAMKKDEEGHVMRSAVLCTGCRSCTLACPFGVLEKDVRLAEFGFSKCDLCRERVAEGLEPACVATCPTGALRFEEASEVHGDRKVLVLGGHVVGHNPFVRR